ncbi:uncharacterized protein LOC132049029 [Lycium ferocissimum]|uniref:uncharacterized protein LOC132049029 n=1 Tax=Lycium ferocissimum TaxID=112874 RepID=UPI002814ECDE|nr:uncharacterized protein LOC132049029 [Lycium ferocissimum]
MYIYLLGVTTVRDAFIKDYNGLMLVRLLILSEKYDLATKLVEHYPDMAKADPNERSPLMELAKKEFALLRGDGLNSWQRLLFRYVPIRSTSEGQKRIPTDIENVSNEPQMFNAKNCWLSPIWERIYFGALITKLGGLPFDVLERLVPPLKLIRDKKSKYYNAVKLVECLCKKIESLSYVEVHRIAGAPLLAAAKNDNYELVEAIVRKFPSLIYMNDIETEKNIFHLAVEHRCENVFNLVHRMSQHRDLLMQSIDSSGNTMLHLAAKLAPKNKLNLVAGAALQMQRELQWFKENIN